MKTIILVCLFSLQFLSPRAQDSLALPKHKIAIFAPLYLDSAYTDTLYRYAKNIFPKFINPGLEFYEGCQLALDSIAKDGIPLEVRVYDTRSSRNPLSQLLNSSELDSIELMIANCSSNEVKLFAEAGLQRNIPFINANLPNDGSVTGNPFFVLLNPTLRTQCEGIYRHVQKYYALNNLVVFRKKGGPMEDMIKNFFDDFNRTTASVPLKFKYVDLIDSFTVHQLAAVLDSNTQTLCISGTLDESFGKRLTLQLASLRPQYRVSVMGMPTWDGFKEFSKPEYKGLEITYATPFYNSKIDKVSASISAYFNTKMYARPTDMVFRGYEVTWKYVHLLEKFGKDIATELGNKQFSVFTDFDIQPILNKQSMTLDYFENKKLYFLKWLDGIAKVN